MWMILIMCSLSHSRTYIRLEMNALDLQNSYEMNVAQKMNFLIIPSIFILFCISRTHSSPGTPLEFVRDSSLKNNEVGKISAINDHPWITSIRWNNEHWCAGSIISENIVLSAAYCTASHWSGNLTVWVGSSSVEFEGSKHEVIAVRNDRTNKYVNIGITGDVALLKVWPPFKFGKNVKKINLANNAYIISSSSRNTIVGWGWSNTLREVSASFVLCPRDVANQSEQFCAIPTDGNFCNGDIGGPFVTNGTQFGFMQQKPSCMEPEQPGVYLKTSYYYDWIKENIIELENDHSWLASIQLNGQHWCAGSIISNEIILTAASCVNSKLESKYTVRVGSPSVNSGGQVYEVVDKKIHEDYVHEYPRTMNDIALLKVEPPITFNLDVGPVKLARKGYTYGPGTNSSVFGWRKVNIKYNSLQLWIAKMRIPHQCSRQYSKSRICATSSNGAGCEGEIGSPLVADGVQFGVRLSDNYCNDNHNSELFNHVPDYRDWITTNSELLIQNKESSRLKSKSFSPLNR